MQNTKKIRYKIYIGYMHKKTQTNNVSDIAAYQQFNGKHINVI